MAKQTARRVLIFKVDKDRIDDILLNFDIASTGKERENIANAVYQILGAYSLELVVTEVQLGMYRISGLAKVPFYQNVVDDINETYLMWYI